MMKKHLRFETAASLTIAAIVGIAFVTNTPTVAQSSYTAADVAQGKYLVEGVGLCLGCHGQTLQGQAPPANAPPNAVPYPKIAGLPMFAKDDDAVKFFETGLLPDGSRAKPPMRQFRFKHTDAIAVTAYLRSVPSQ
jgi:mono/diheme cytochrome c family protein